jgi:hypothetical protein
MSLLSRTMDRLRERRGLQYDDGWMIDLPQRRTLHAVDPASGESATAEDDYGTIRLISTPDDLSMYGQWVRDGRPELCPPADYGDTMDRSSAPEREAPRTGCGQHTRDRMRQVPVRTPDGLIRDAVFGWRREP